MKLEQIHRIFNEINRQLSQGEHAAVLFRDGLNWFHVLFTKEEWERQTLEQKFNLLKMRIHRKTETINDSRAS